MINDNYLSGLAKLMVGASYSIPSHGAVGSTTGTLTATDIVTSGEFDRDTLSFDRSLNTSKFGFVRSASEAGNEVINVASFTNSATPFGTSDIQVNMLIASLTHTTDFDVEIEAWVTHSRG